METEFVIGCINHDGQEYTKLFDTAMDVYEWLCGQREEDFESIVLTRIDDDEATVLADGYVDCCNYFCATITIALSGRSVGLHYGK